MKPWCPAACLAVFLVPSVHAASWPDTLTLERAESLASAPARPERLAAAAAAAGARAESLAFRATPPVEWSLMHGRAGERFAAGEQRTWELEAARAFDPWGHRRQEAVAAGLGARAALRAGEALDQALRIEARAALRAAAFADRRLARLEMLAEGERSLARRVAARVAEGSMKALEGRLTALERARVEAELGAAEAAREAARLSLAQALGIPDGDWARRVTLHVSDALDTLAARLDPDRLVDSRPDLAEARLRAEAAAARERAAALAARPELTVSLGATFESAESGPDVFVGDPGGLTGLRAEDRGLALRVSAPLPGRAQARAVQAEAAAARARAEADAATLTLARRAEAAAAQAAFERAARTAALWRALGEQAGRDLERVREAYADGRLSYADYVALRRQLVEAVTESLELESGHWEALAAFERACGTTIATLKGVR